jgi:hypothetical protein
MSPKWNKQPILLENSKEEDGIIKVKYFDVINNCLDLYREKLLADKAQGKR